MLLEDLKAIRDRKEYELKEEKRLQAERLHVEAQALARRKYLKVYLAELTDLIASTEDKQDGDSICS